MMRPSTGPSGVVRHGRRMRHPSQADPPVAWCAGHMPGPSGRGPRVTACDERTERPGATLMEGAACVARMPGPSGEHPRAATCVERIAKPIRPSQACAPPRSRGSLQPLATGPPECSRQRWYRLRWPSRIWGLRFSFRTVRCGGQTLGTPGTRTAGENDHSSHGLREIKVAGTGTSRSFSFPCMRIGS